MSEKPLVRLPKRFVLTITGDRERWDRNPVPHNQMAHALMELFSGKVAARSTFARWDMQIEVGHDTDGGPEEI
ncbi:MAG: hypothetical protein JWO15_1693 [Sphingomonadales bacterium]|nr:hypothetical protein [Sphingomonadales bacterium]